MCRFTQDIGILVYMQCFNPFGHPRYVTAENAIFHHLPPPLIHLILLLFLPTFMPANLLLKGEIDREPLCAYKWNHPYEVCVPKNSKWLADIRCLVSFNRVVLPLQDDLAT